MTMGMSGQRLDCHHHHLWTRERVDRGDYHWMPEGGGPLHEPAQRQPAVQLAHRSA
jgi:hypothetical protein